MLGGSYWKRATGGADRGEAKSAAERGAVGRRRATKFLRKSIGSKSQPLATIPRHECGQRVYHGGMNPRFVPAHAHSTIVE